MSPGISFLLLESWHWPCRFINRQGVGIWHIVATLEHVWDSPICNWGVQGSIGETLQCVWYSWGVIYEFFQAATCLVFLFGLSPFLRHFFNKCIVSRWVVEQYRSIYFLISYFIKGIAFKSEGTRIDYDSDWLWRSRY